MRIYNTMYYLPITSKLSYDFSFFVVNHNSVLGYGIIKIKVIKHIKGAVKQENIIYQIFFFSRMQTTKTVKIFLKRFVIKLACIKKVCI